MLGSPLCHQIGEQQGSRSWLRAGREGPGGMDLSCREDFQSAPSDPWGPQARPGVGPDGPPQRRRRSHWIGVASVLSEWRPCPSHDGHGRMGGIKTIGRLVPVSFVHCCTSTPGLSTWWSSTALIGSTGFEVRFPLRCLQRLSSPHIATLQCGWRHNRSTRGVSIPVLSY